MLPEVNRQNNMGNYHGKAAEQSTWTIDVQLTKTIKYTINKGNSTIVKTTGVAPSLVKYEVDGKTGDMVIVKDDGTKITSGQDGNLKDLIVVLQGMVSEIGGYIPIETPVSTPVVESTPQSENTAEEAKNEVEQTN